MFTMVYLLDVFELLIDSFCCASDAFVVDELFKPKRSKLSHAPELVHAPALRLVGISEPAPSPTLFNHTLKIG